MRFRPCIDIHNAKVKQIVGGSLKDKGNFASENYVSEYDAAYYAGLYKDNNLPGGHVILLNKPSSEYYEGSKQMAIAALKAYPDGLQLGGGITPENADIFLDAGASHVIVTSYVFNNGVFDEKALDRMVSCVGSKRLVLDLSCRKKDNDYYIVTDRWQKFTSVKLDKDILRELSLNCDEFLIHASDVEGLSSGIEEDIVKLLSDCPVSVTYAGGIHDMDDIVKLETLGKGKVDFTVGSALDIFGGNMRFDEIKLYCKSC